MFPVPRLLVCWCKSIILKILRIPQEILPRKRLPNIRIIPGSGRFLQPRVTYRAKEISLSAVCNKHWIWLPRRWRRWKHPFCGPSQRLLNRTIRKSRRRVWLKHTCWIWTNMHSLRAFVKRDTGIFPLILKNASIVLRVLRKKEPG